jgi:hypothetical protein
MESKMKTNMKTELQTMRRELIVLERAFETQDEDRMFAALAGMRQANVYFGRELTRKINRRASDAYRSAVKAAKEKESNIMK